MSHTIVVKKHHPQRRMQIKVAVLIATLLLGYGLFEFGRWAGGYQVLSAGAAQDILEAQIEVLEQQNEAIREERSVMQRTAEIEKQAYEELEKEFADLQNESLELREELAFYRGIVTPQNGAKGLQIQDFSITKGLTQGAYRYNLVLTQLMNNDRFISGAVSFELEGALNGQRKVLEHSQFINKDDETKFRFKYFQTLEGEFNLPEGMVPSRLTVKVNPSGKGKSTLEKVINWPY